MVYQFGERMSDDDIELMFVDQDSERKGQITYEEFMSFFQAHF